MFGSHELGHGLDVRSVYALEDDVVVIDHFPDGPIIQTANAIDGNIVLLYIIAVVICRIRNGFGQVGLRDVFGSGQKTIVAISIQIQPLVPSHLAYRR